LRLLARPIPIWATFVHASQRIDDEWRYIDHLVTLDFSGDTRFHLKGGLGSS
jgi:hypothetical protein